MNAVKEKNPSASRAAKSLVFASKRSFPVYQSLQKKPPLTLSIYIMKETWKKIRQVLSSGTKRIMIVYTPVN